jgi:hypothetical protein
VPLVLIGLAHQLMVPDVAFPGAVDVPPAAAAVVLPLLAVVLLLLLLHPAAASAPTATRAPSCPILVKRLAYLCEPARAMHPPTISSRSITICNNPRGLRLRESFLGQAGRLRAVSLANARPLAVPRPSDASHGIQPSRMIWVS